MSTRTSFLAVEVLAFLVLGGCLAAKAGDPTSRESAGAGESTNVPGAPGQRLPSGTQVIVTFKDDALIGGKLPDDGLVRELLAVKAAGHERLASTTRVDRIEANRVGDFLRDHDTNGDGKVTRSEWVSQGLNPGYFDHLAGMAGAQDGLTRDILKKYLPPKSYVLVTKELDVQLVWQAVVDAFGTTLSQRLPLDFDLKQGTAQGADANREMARSMLRLDFAPDGLTPITKALAEKASPRFRSDLLAAEGGVLLVVSLKKSVSQHDVEERLRDVGFRPEFSKLAKKRIAVAGLTPDDRDTYSEFALIMAPTDPALAANPKAWANFAQQAYRLVEEALHQHDPIPAVHIDAPK